ncbi:hypothetical protein ACFPM7_21105 [Actinokineospora guangxiensis]|uniref:Serine active site containing 1-like protein n=1 Tax=Actinokineospora guangxiensis TaxID=1490288 RepID=A0ABW0EU17_9PSEU
MFSMLNITRSPGSRAIVLGLTASAVLTGVVWLLGQRLHDVALLPDQGAAWYYWQLPEPTAVTRASAWLGYAAHQIVSWGLIYYAQTRVRQYTSGLHKVNVVALAANFGFIVLHLVQTQLFYDGLAQDVSIFSSQASVVMLLVAVLLMENRRRGLLLGKPAPLGQEVVRFVRRYHGYLFSWAIIYTFWYHPMESTSGHLIGFFYMFLLMAQGSLFFTRAHTNRWWTLLLEVMVAVHGTLVAVMNSGAEGMWPMFLFGFLAIFVLTQMHGVGLSRRTRWVLGWAFIAAVLGVYLWRGIGRIDEVVRIPVIEYALVGVLAALVWLGLRIAALLRPREAEPDYPPPEDGGSAIPISAMRSSRKRP